MPLLVLALEQPETVQGRDYGFAPQGDVAGGSLDLDSGACCAGHNVKVLRALEQQEFIVSQVHPGFYASPNLKNKTLV